jgi:hypothetical protein
MPTTRGNETPRRNSVTAPAEAANHTTHTLAAMMPHIRVLLLWLLIGTFLDVGEDYVSFSRAAFTGSVHE